MAVLLGMAGLSRASAQTTPINTGVIHGAITTQQTTPLAGVAVKLIDATGRIVANTASDYEGRFRIGNLTPGTYRVMAALDAMAAANPGMAPMIQTLETSKLYKVSANQLTGDLIVTAALPAQGLSLAQIGQALTAQFALIPGASTPPSPDPTSLPAGDALHWPITVSANNTAGKPFTASESVYLVSNGRTAVLVEFVTPAGGVAADEGSILDTLAFK